MTAAAAPLALLIAKLWKSRDHRVHVRVDLGEHKGHPLVNIRIWETGTDGIDRPTVKGVALGIRKLPPGAPVADQDSEEKPRRAKKTKGKARK